jgi:hypothetical protein
LDFFENWGLALTAIFAILFLIMEVVVTKNNCKHSHYFKYSIQKQQKLAPLLKYSAAIALISSFVHGLDFKGILTRELARWRCAGSDRPFDTISTFV